MPPSYSDVDDVQESFYEFKQLSDVENDDWNMTQTRLRERSYSFAPSFHRPLSFPARSAYRKPPSRQRKTSDVSDMTYSDNENFSDASVDSLQDFEMFSKVDRQEVNQIESGYSIPVDMATALMDISSVNSNSISDVDENRDSQVKIEGRRKRITKSLKGNDKTPASQKSQNKKSRRRTHRQTRVHGNFQSDPMDSAVENAKSASDIDESWTRMPDEESQEDKASDSEDLTVSDNTLRGGGDTDWSAQGSMTFRTKVTNQCKMCCDIDVGTILCPMCNITLCETCSGKHTDSHCENLWLRIHRVREQAFDLLQSQPYIQLIVQLDEAIQRLLLASQRANDRAVAIYRSASAKCTDFIGSLVDRRIKLSSSLKYLLRQIPIIPLTRDMVAVAYFQKVANGVKDRLEELKVLIDDPEAKSISRYAISTTFSPNGPLLGHNNLILSLVLFTSFQGHSDDLVERASSMHF